MAIDPKTEPQISDSRQFGLLWVYLRTFRSISWSYTNENREVEVFDGLCAV